MMSVDTDINISVDNDEVPAERVVLHDEGDHSQADGQYKETGSSQADVPDADVGQVEKIQGALADFIGKLKLTSSDMLRTTAAHRALWRFGRPLRDPEFSRQLYGWSDVTKRVAQFWSHSWHGSVVAKLLLLQVMYNGLPAVLVGSAFVAITLLLLLHVCALPCSIERNGQSAIAVSVGLLASSLTFFLWRSGQRIFLDRICIHQTDEKLKMMGLLNVGAVLKKSDSLLVCFDDTYIRRLWCVLEISAYLKSNGQEGINIKPTSWGVSIVILFLSANGIFLGAAGVGAILRHSAGVTTILGDGQRLGFLLWAILGSIALPGSLITFSLVSRSLRAHFRAVDHILKQLETFSVKEDTVSHCCTINHLDRRTGTAIPCDRKILEKCLELWFGSVQAFDEFIQNELSVVFRKLTTSTLPYTWVVAAGSPLLWFYAGTATYHLRTENYKAAARMLFYIPSWWLAIAPTYLQLFVCVARRVRRQRQSPCQEVLVNLGCSMYGGLIYFVIAFFEGFWYAMFGTDVPSMAAFTVVVMAICALIRCMPCGPKHRA
ncbi:unnamed protein product [Symbiodinium natans]|uniref:Transmembrane protein n=1 Tax=Symbiodinium natans TaxID=878477 RepID=A0A812SR10_9DINO|nr:unnamed protein product [Symbiodinium natans]